ncbi:MAG: hypothetical protein PHG04_03845 [Candidatus Nanoarchaeia archaeon]|nr:hypothetical protein [Candidatus Nanoarchaeia archaeon]MDD5054480.1 hypothetical protein [Candidatus Nanoarchaeia archaeon]
MDLKTIFGIMFIIFSLISLSRSNIVPTASYFLIAIFIFLPKSIINLSGKKKAIIIAILCIIIGIYNNIQNGTETYEYYNLTESFSLPSNPEYNISITRIVNQPNITTANMTYITDGFFLLIYANLSSVNKTIAPMFVLVNSEGQNYNTFNLNDSLIEQNDSFNDELFAIYNLALNTTKLSLIFTETTLTHFNIINLGI